VPYLIDGNNLLGSWGDGCPSREGRSEVVRRVAAFCRARGASATIVFDGVPFRPELGSGQDLGRVTLRFPIQGADADSLIRDLVDGATRPGEILVVTSDKALYSYVRTRGAAVLRAHEWNALASGARPRGRRRQQAGSEKPEREVDIEGWLERFSRE
jgi:predicted RNA-binding protein with PIN domain